MQPAAGDDALNSGKSLYKTFFLLAICLETLLISREVINIHQFFIHSLGEIIQDLLTMLSID